MKKKIALILLGSALIGVLANHYLIDASSSYERRLSFFTAILFIVGFILALPFNQISNYIFDPREWEQNKSLENIVFKLRIRAILFNNIAISIFVVIIMVILTGFYLLVDPPMDQVNNERAILPTSLTIRIGSSVLLIFLVGILFRVFKYLLRVAAFYHSKADALEFSKIKPDIPFEKLIEIFTPEKYDISELDQASVAANIVDMVNAKLGKP